MLRNHNTIVLRTGLALLCQVIHASLRGKPMLTSGAGGELTLVAGSMNADSCQKW